MITESQPGSIGWLSPVETANAQGDASRAERKIGQVRGIDRRVPGCDQQRNDQREALPAAPPAAAPNMVCLCGDIERMNQMIDIALDIVLIVMLVFCLGALAWGSDG